MKKEKESLQSQSLIGKVKQRQIVLSNILYTKCSPMSSKK